MSNAIQTQASPESIQGMLTKHKNQIAMALPKHMTPDRMLRISLTELRKNPGLQKCDPVSFVGSVVQCSQIGLEPGSALGHVYLIPFGRQVQVIIGYRGMLELARRSGQISSISAHCAYRNDKFKYSLGLEPTIEHEPTDGERGELTFAYAVARLKDGGLQFEVMSRSEIDAIKARSKTSHSGPWVTDYPEMAKKTVLRRLSKYLPMSSEVAGAIDSEDDEKPFEILSMETGEPIEIKPTISAQDVAEHQLDLAIETAAAKVKELGEDAEFVLDVSLEKARSADIHTKKFYLMKLNKFIAEERK